MLRSDLPKDRYGKNGNSYAVLLRFLRTKRVKLRLKNY